ncbi:hypothetical protein D3C75_526400 [compost metagenome]
MAGRRTVAVHDIPADVGNGQIGIRDGQRLFIPLKLEAADHNCSLTRDYFNPVQPVIQSCQLVDNLIVALKAGLRNNHSSLQLPIHIDIRAAHIALDVRSPADADAVKIKHRRGIRRIGHVRHSVRGRLKPAIVDISIVMRYRIPVRHRNKRPLLQPEIIKICPVSAGSKGNCVITRLECYAILSGRNIAGPASCCRQRDGGQLLPVDINILLRVLIGSVCNS